MPEVLKTPYKTCPRTLSFQSLLLYESKNPVKIIPACSTCVWWWKLEVQPCHASFPIVCFSHCSIPVTILKFIYSPFQLIIFIMLSIFILWFTLFISRSCCPASGGLSVKVELFVLHSVVLQCEILVLLLLPKENCLLYKRIWILFAYQSSREIWKWKYKTELGMS